ncbi:ATP-binding protein [Streptomyces sp. NPDC001339]|uniref:ATP-binding protein n=1 Tax=Streptomyces sp. NPDC001339 TaxID=3364563 RepID=UPI003674A1BB
MLCDPEYRKQLPLDDLDPATVPPDLPAPAVPNPAGRTAAHVRRLLAEHFGLSTDRSAGHAEGDSEDIFTEFTELATRAEPVSIVVPDVDQAGPVRAANEPARLVRDVLTPLAATETVQLLADVPRELAAELAGALPHGQVQLIDLDAPEWADPEGLVLHAETALDRASGAPERSRALPHATTDPVARRALAEALAERAAGNRLTLQLAVRSLLMPPHGFGPPEPTDAAALLPGSIGEALDLHARRLGADPQTLRLVLAPLAFAEGEGLPVQLLAPLATAVAGRDMSQDVADGMPLAAPFIQTVEAPQDADGTPDEAPSVGGRRPLLRLMHPGIAEEIRSGLPDVRDAQTKIATALLEAVPQQDWSRADPYIRDHLAAHTLEAGLLPQLLTDPGLFAHANPVTLRAAIEAVPLEQLGAPARTYLRTAPLLTRTQAPAGMRAAFLESAFVEDGLAPYAEALHKLGFDLPWRTLWSAPLTGVRAVTIGVLRQDSPPQAAEAGAEAPAPASTGSVHHPVAAFLVPEGTPGARTLPSGTDGTPESRSDRANSTDLTASGEVGLALLHHNLLTPEYLDADPSQVVQPSEKARAAAPYGLSRDADSLRVRVRSRATEQVVTTLVSDTPITGAALSPDGVLVIATERGVTARQILTPVITPAPAAAT